MKEALEKVKNSLRQLLAEKKEIAALLSQNESALKGAVQASEDWKIQYEAEKHAREQLNHQLKDERAKLFQDFEQQILSLQNEKHQLFNNLTAVTDEKKQFVDSQKKEMQMKIEGELILHPSCLSSSHLACDDRIVQEQGKYRRKSSFFTENIQAKDRRINSSDRKSTSRDLPQDDGDGDLEEELRQTSFRGHRLVEIFSTCLCSVKQSVFRGITIFSFFFVNSIHTKVFHCKRNIINSKYSIIH